MNGFLRRNDPDALIEAAIVALVVLALSIAARRFLLERLAAAATKTATVLDDVLVHVLRSIRGWGWSAIALAAGLSQLDFTENQQRLLHHAFVLVLALQLGIALQSALALAVEKRREKEGRPGTATTLAAVDAVGRLVVWSAVVLVGLSNLGVQVSALAATLGVGGLAAAFAVQNVLGDLFASLSIYLDRPFDIGDAIQVDDLSGVVEHISWRSTRVRSTTGEQLVFANGDLTRARIRNFRRLSERRVLLTFRLPLDTPVDVLDKMPARVKEIVEALKDVRFERAHVTDVGESALVLETVFWCTRSEYEAMLDRKQAVILGMRRALDSHAIAFAVPRTMVERRDAS